MFNVSASVNATGSTALELLRKSPGVTVDKDDNISLRGKNGVQIYIDGRPSYLGSKELAALLHTLQSADIEAIEIISNPSAKYDAEGNAGIINIRLKKGRKFGFNGNVSATGSVGFYSQYNASLGLNYREKKYNVYANYSFDNGQYHETLNIYRIQNDTLYEQKSVNVDTWRPHNVKAGIDFFANDKHTFGAMMNANVGAGSWVSRGNTFISNHNTGQVASLLYATNDIEMERSNWNYNLNYRFADTLGKSFNVDVDYGFYKNRADSYQPNFYNHPTSGEVLTARIFSSRTPTDIDIYTAKADYEQPLWKGKLSLGAKTALVKTDNTLEFFQVQNGENIFDSDRSSHFTYTENVNAAYLNYQHALGKKWSLQTGVRAEHTHSIGDLESETPQPEDYVESQLLGLFPQCRADL